MIASVFGCQNVPIFDFVFASTGQSQLFETPTIFSPSPKANTISVKLGESETILCGGQATALQKNTIDNIADNFFISCSLELLFQLLQCKFNNGWSSVRTIAGALDGFLVGDKLLNLAVG